MIICNKTPPSGAWRCFGNGVYCCLWLSPYIFDAFVLCSHHWTISQCRRLDYSFLRGGGLDTCVFWCQEALVPQINRNPSLAQWLIDCEGDLRRSFQARRWGQPCQLQNGFLCTPEFPLLIYRLILNPAMKSYTPVLLTPVSISGGLETG